MGLLTGTGGGILRDLICNEIPLFLRQEIYVFAGVIGGVLFLSLHHYQLLHPTVNALLSVAVIFIIRMLAVYYDWSLPAFSEEWFRQARRNRHS